MWINCRLGSEEMASGRNNERIKGRAKKGSAHHTARQLNSNNGRGKGSGPLRTLKASIAAQAQAYIGAPVCTVLKDGRYRYGVIREIRGDQVILEGFEGSKKLPRNKTKAKAQIAGLGGLLGMLGGPGGMLGMLSKGLGGLSGGGGAGAGGLLGGLGKGIGGGGGAGGLLGGLSKGIGGGGGGFFGSIGRFMPIAMKTISFIMPLMKGFSI
jgi:hypothetical protein